MTSGDAALLFFGGLSTLLWVGGRAMRLGSPGRWGGVWLPAALTDDRVWRDANRVAGAHLQRFATLYLLLNVLLVFFPDVPALFTSALSLTLAMAWISWRALRYARQRAAHYATIDEAVKQSDRGKRA